MINLNELKIISNDLKDLSERIDREVDKVPVIEIAAETIAHKALYDRYHKMLWGFFDKIRTNQIGKDTIEVNDDGDEDDLWTEFIVLGAVDERVCVLIIWASKFDSGVIVGDFMGNNTYEAASYEGPLTEASVIQALVEVLCLVAIENRFVNVR
jgi:hypothetical protein